jgi:putative salt-induced outer membrane protein
VFKKSVVLICLCSISIKIFSHDKINPSYWNGSNALFGFNDTSGNTNTSSLNAGINLNYTRGKWQEVANLTTNYGKENGALSQEQYFVQNQLNYSISKNDANYIFANGNSTFDHFSPYSYQLNTFAGYGRRLLQQNKITLSLQVGPGLGRTKERDNHEINNNITANPQATIAWQITKSNQLKEVASATYSKPFNYYKSVASLTTNILHHLATSINFQVEHYSRIPKTVQKTRKTDTTTSVNLVYTF